MDSEDPRRGPSLVRAWVRIHSTDTATLELVGVTILSILSVGLGIDRLGPVLFPTPVLAVLVVPVLAGVTVATAAVADAQGGLPDPWFARVTRLAWGTAWLLAALGGALAGTILTSSDSGLALAITRNVLIYSAVSLPLATEGRSQLLWMPAVLLALTAAVFGRSGNDERWQWWAVMFSERVADRHMVVALLLALVSLLHYALRRPLPARSGAM